MSERDIHDTKVRLRRRVLADRDDLGRTERAQLSSAVCNRAAELPEVRTARTIMLYASFRSEVDTAPLIRLALARGVQVCLPRILGPRRMEAFRITDPSSDLAPGTWGIPEPDSGLPRVPAEAIDAVIVPGTVFDEAGGRCGYGGGFYDNYLLGARAGMPSIGLAMELQLVDKVPREPHDLGVDVIVTETRVIRPG
jgi:5-formyltetrahydrofolate cyclo-ligase